MAQGQDSFSKIIISKYTIAIAVSFLVLNVAVRTFSGSPENHEALGISPGDCGVDQPVNFSGGPPDARTGAPLTTAGMFEATCNAGGCHSSFATNSGDGSFIISPPASYLPSETVNVAIALEDPAQMRWGFEMTVLDANNQPVGELLVVDGVRVQKSLVVLTGREYLKHRSTGTDAFSADSSLGWTVQWVAPLADVGVVTFFGAGNAANNNGLNNGDFIYTSNASMTLSTADTDNDGLMDAVEILLGLNPGSTDSDGDGVGDFVEIGDPSSPTDTDGDQTIDALDTDDDDDGILTTDEDVNGNGDPTDDDTDSDNLANYLDTDDDGDGILTVADACPLIVNPCPGTCCAIAGDYDNNGSFNIADVTAGIARIFTGGAAPSCQDQADADGNNSFNIADVTFGIARIFTGGTAPVCGTTGS